MTMIPESGRTKRRRSPRHLRVVLVSLVGAAVGANCTAPHRSYQPTQDPATLDNVSFLHYLATVPVVTVDEGVRAVLLLADDPAARSTFDERIAALGHREAVKQAWHLQPDQILDKGTLAYMLRTVCRLRRSVNERLAASTGWGDRRYALQTCIHAKLLPYGLAHEPVTGGELLSALTAAERYLGPDDVYKP